MKKCTKCLKNRPLNDYHWDNKSKGYRASRCKDCIANYKKECYQENKEYYKNKYQKWSAQGRQYVWNYLLDHPCVDCGEEDRIVLEFDHIDPSKKRRGIATLRGHSSLDKLKAEMKKCEVRCANCHRRKTAHQFGHYKDLQTIPVSMDELLSVLL